jgi:uncharacterized membrane protein
MRHLPAALLILAGTLLVASPADAQRLRATYQDLGPFPGAVVTEPRAINDRGDIVGYAYADGRDIAFLWTRKDGYQVIAYGALPNDVNNRGEVVGLIDLCEVLYDCVQRGFLWTRKDGLQDLGAFAPYAINDSGTMAGACTEAPPVHRPCTRRRDTVRDLGIPGRAEAINARGDVIGYPAFIWSREGVATVDEPGALEVLLKGINNRGDVVGTRTFLGGTYGGVRQLATIWTADGPVSPDRPDNTVGLATNNRGLVVGFSWSAAPPFAFVWQPGGSFLMLPAPGLISSRAYAINSPGQIVGSVWYPDGTSGIGLWTVR